MSKVAIVFWSQTGNTETMANCIAEGAGAAATIVPCAEMDAAKLGEYDVVAFGCPAMGAEELEETEEGDETVLEEEDFDIMRGRCVWA